MSLWPDITTHWDLTVDPVTETTWDQGLTTWDSEVIYHLHGEVAWNHFLAQHGGKQATEDFVRSFYPPLDALDKALYDLYTMRRLDTAQGVQVDGIGSIVGISRTLPGSVYLPFFGFVTQPSGRAFGVARMRHKGEPYAQSYTLGDRDYKQLLYIKIAVNNSNGTAEDLIRTFEYTLQVDGISVKDTGNATADVRIPENIPPGDPRRQLLNYLVTSAAGVKLNPVFFTPTPTGDDDVVY